MVDVAVVGLHYHLPDTDTLTWAEPEIVKLAGKVRQLFWLTTPDSTQGYDYKAGKRLLH
jgi:hypothetical protein